MRNSFPSFCRRSTVLTVVMVGLFAVWTAPVAANKNNDDRRDARELIANLQQDLNDAKRDLAEARSSVKRLRPAQAEAETAYRSAETAYRESKSAETRVIQRIQLEIDSDPRPVAVRRTLDEARAVERERREQLMPKIERSEEYTQLQNEIASLERQLEERQSAPEPDTEALAALATQLLEANRNIDDLLHRELGKNPAYHAAREDLDSAERAFAEVEREISRRISDDPERMRLGETAGQARIAYESARRRYQDMTRALQSAESQIDSASRRISQIQGDISRARVDAGGNRKRKN